MKTLRADVVWTEEAIVDAALYGVDDNEIEPIAARLSRDPFAGDAVDANIRRLRFRGNDWRFHFWRLPDRISITIMQIRPAADEDRRRRTRSFDESHRRALEILARVASLFFRR